MAIEGWAHFSDDGQYRYALGRKWANDNEKVVVWVGLNPSTATGEKGDPTIWKLTEFSHRWGFHQFTIVNLFSFRSPKPSALLRVDDPIGPETDTWLLYHVLRASLVVACWGAKGVYRGRDTQVRELLRPCGPLSCLGVNGNGTPKHPLYLAATTQLELYR